MVKRGVCKMFEDSLKETLKVDMRCIVGRWLSTLDDKEVKIITDAVEKHTIGTTFRAAKNYTYTGGTAAWYKHWNRLCLCSKKV